MRGAQCDTLAAVLSERRSGELAPEASRALDAHLAGCARCQAEASAVDSLLESLVPPEVSAAELQALSARRIGKTLPRPAPSRWGVRALLVAAAAAALLTLATRPRTAQHAPRVTAPGATALPADEEVFGEDVFLDDDPSDDGAQLDALTLEGPGLFGSLER